MHFLPLLVSRIRKEGLINGLKNKVANCNGQGAEDNYPKHPRQTSLWKRRRPLTGIHTVLLPCAF